MIKQDLHKQELSCGARFFLTGRFHQFNDADRSFIGEVRKTAGALFMCCRIPSAPINQ